MTSTYPLPRPALARVGQCGLRMAFALVGPLIYLDGASGRPAAILLSLPVGAVLSLPTLLGKAEIDGRRIRYRTIVSTKEVTLPSGVEIGHWVWPFDRSVGLGQVGFLGRPDSRGYVGPRVWLSLPGSGCMGRRTRSVWVAAITDQCDDAIEVVPVPRSLERPR